MNDNVKRECVYTDGTPVPSGYCVMPDHYTTTLTVVVRSSRPISSERITNLIQQQHEVVSCLPTHERCVVRKD